jgi:hypothetical protein
MTESSSFLAIIYQTLKNLCTPYRARGDADALTVNEVKIRELTLSCVKTQERLDQIMQELRVLKSRLYIIVQGKQAMNKNVEDQMKGLLLEKKRLDELYKIKFNQLSKLNNIYDTISITQDSLVVADIMKDGQRQLSNLTQKMGGVDGVHDLVDNTSDALQSANDINLAIATPFNLPTGPSRLDGGYIDVPVVESAEDEFKRMLAEIDEFPIDDFSRPASSSSPPAVYNTNPFPPVPDDDIVIETSPKKLPKTLKSKRPVHQQIPPNIQRDLSAAILN